MPRAWPAERRRQRHASIATEASAASRRLRCAPQPEYARTWGQAIPQCGAELIGYFAPHEGSATTAYGVYSIESLAAYEAYRARLGASPLARENVAFARRERFILKEDRVFLRLVSAPHATRVRP